MDVFLLVLCLSHSALLLGILFFGGVKAKREFERIKCEREEEDLRARMIVVRQEAGDVKLAYLQEPKEDKRPEEGRKKEKKRGSK